MRDAGSRFAGSTQDAGRSALLGFHRLSAGRGASAVRALPARIGLGLLGLALVWLLLFAGSARAAYDHVAGPTFELEGMAGGQPGQLAVDEETGDVYAMARSGSMQGDLGRYKANGEPYYFPGKPGPNESQTVHFAGFVTEDKFTLTCPGGETTGEIEWTSNSTTLQGNMKAGLEATCGPSFSITSGPNNPIVQFEGAYASTDVPHMTCTKTEGAGTCEITTEVNGAAESNVIDTPCGSSCLQVAVDNSGGPNQGTIYVSTSDSQTSCCPTKPNDTSGGIEVFSPSTGELTAVIHSRSQFEFNVRSCGVIVDENGNLDVLHGEGQEAFTYIDKLDILPWATNPEQTPPVVETFGGDFGQPCKAQVNSAGSIYALSGNSQTSTGQIRYWEPNVFGEPDPAGERVPPSLTRHSEVLDSGPARGFAIDGEDNIFVNRTNNPQRIRKFDSSGSLIETFGEGELYEPQGVAFNKATNRLYVSDGSTNVAAKDIHIYEPVTVPDSLTGKFEPSGQTEGALTGNVDPLGAGEIEACDFEYTPETTFKSKEFEEATELECEPAAPITSAEEVEAAISGLTLEQPYKFRVVSKNANGTSNGTVHTFVPHAVIGLETEDATQIAPRSATLHASFIGNSDETEYFFEYGEGIGYGETTPIVTGSPSGEVPIAVPVSGLELETTYHFRIKAVNSTGTSVGTDHTFTTPPAVAGLHTQAATEIGQEGITLNGQFTGNGDDTHYVFEYGQTKEYGLLSSEEDAGPANGTTPISSVITSFSGYTTYHYRVVAENSLGKSYGKDMTFTTPPAPLPEISNTTVSNIQPTSAVFSAEVNPNRWQTAYLFEWGTTTEYGEATSLENVIGGLDQEMHPVSLEGTGLTPGKVYHYRAVALNLTGVTNGPDQTFITPAAPRIEGASSSSVGETTAHLAALVVAGGRPTSVSFEYGAGGYGWSGGYGSSTPATQIGSDLIAQPAGADLSGLQPGTTYHFRVVASNAIGTATGSDLEFTTQPAPAPPPPKPKRKHCPKGKVKRHGKCVRRHRKKHHHKKHRHHRHGKRHG